MLVTIEVARNLILEPKITSDIEALGTDGAG